MDIETLVSFAGNIWESYQILIESFAQGDINASENIRVCLLLMMNSSFVNSTVKVDEGTECFKEDLKKLMSKYFPNGIPQEPKKVKHLLIVK